MSTSQSIPKPACSYCRGAGVVGNPPGAQLCPLCEGSKSEFDPGSPFDYEMGPITVANNGVQNNQTIQLNFGRGFRWLALAGVATAPGFLTLRIYRGRDQYAFMNQQVLFSNIVGTAQNPFPLLAPFEFVYGELIACDFTDLGSGGNNVVRLSFHGVELAPLTN